MKLGPYVLGPNDTEENGIYTGDARELAKVIPDESIDLVLTDPPYGTVDGRGKVTMAGSEIVAFNPGEWDESLPLWWVPDAMRALIDGSWVCAFTDKLSVKALWDEIENHGGRAKQTFHFVKSNPRPQPRPNFCSGVESAVVATKGAVGRWFGGGCTPNYLICPSAPASERTGHPTQKPLRLMRHLIMAMSTRGDVVFDPFVGSGSTAAACKQLGRRYLAFEIDPDTAEMARQRVRETQPPLFVTEPEPQQSEMEL